MDTFGQFPRHKVLRVMQDFERHPQAAAKLRSAEHNEDDVVDGG